MASLATITEAIDRVERNAPDAWKEAAYEALRAIAARQAALSANDVWECVGDPPTPCALGPVMLRAKREGLIKMTGFKVPSDRETNHRDFTLWQSLVYVA